ncbi:MAG TPA: AI-2E family transporter [Gemmatimonadales bacterium]|nr:AI-2E family transporter [Gemmatimonadales bacterium]
MTDIAVQVQELIEPRGASRPSRLVPFTSRLLIPVLTAILAVLGIAGLQFASSLLVPIVVAVLLTLLLGPLVRWMCRFGVVEPVAAGIIVFGTVILIISALVVLSGPATEWLRRAPAAMHQVEDKLRAIEPLSVIQATAMSLSHLTGSAGSDSSAATIQVVPPGPLSEMGWTTAHVVGGLLTVVFLTFFLLSSGSMFRRKVAYLVPGGIQRTRMKRALYEIEQQMSHYLLLNTLISMGFGLATWGLLALIGVPNAILWGTLAGFSNFMPYLGAAATVVMIGIVTLATFDGTQATILACGGFLLLDLIKGHLVCPLVLGRRLPLNTVAILLSLLFWGWVWGIMGVIIAVPLTVMIQIICSHTERFRGVGIVLGNWGAQHPT